MYIYIIIGTLYCETNNIARPSPPSPITVYRFILHLKAVIL